MTRSVKVRVAATVIALLALSSIGVWIWLHPAGSYFPMKAGSYWNYNVTWTPAAGDTERSTMTTRAAGLETIAGRQYMKFETSRSKPAGAQQDFTYFRAAQDGIYAANGPAENDVLILPFSPVPGTTWPFDDKSTHTHGHMRVSSGLTVVIPSGTYTNCLKVVREYDLDNSKGLPPSERVTLFYAEGVGLIKISRESVAGRSVALLEKYEP